MTQMPPEVDVPSSGPGAAGAGDACRHGLTADKVERLIVKTLYAGECPVCSSPTASGFRIPFSSLISSAHVASAY